MTSEDNNWIENSTPIEDLDIEIHFHFPKNFYFGERFNINQYENSDFYKLLILPRFYRAEPLNGSTREIIGHEEELAAYYKQVVETAAERKKTFAEVSNHFRLELRLWNSEKNIHISNPWYQTLDHSMKPFFDWVKLGEYDSKFLDDSPDWKFEALCKENCFHIRMIDDEYNEINTSINISTDKDLFIKKLALMEERAHSIIKNLNAELGVDVWSSRPQNPLFGNSTWQPKKLPNSMPLSMPFLFVIIDTGVAIFKSKWVMKAICISIIMVSLILCFVIEYLGNKEIQKIERRHTYEVTIERAAIKNFDSVKRFFKVVPDAFLVDNKFSDFVFGKEIMIYSCNLPEFSTKDEVVFFKGEPTFEVKSLLKSKKGTELKMSIDEFENAINEK